MGSHALARRRLAVGIAAASFFVGMSNAPAYAAGSGYTSGPPGPSHPPGFSGVVSAKTFGKAGGRFQVRYFKIALLDLFIPKGHFIRPLQVVFTTGHAPTVAKYLVGELHGDVSVLSFGVLFQYMSTSVLLGRPVSLLITDPEIKKGDIITVYSNGHFVEVSPVHHNGVLILYVRGGEQFAIVAPPHK
jgi:hypothetical protein